LDTTGLNTQQKVVGREQDSKEGERGRVLLQMSDCINNKIGRWRKIF